MAIPSKGRLAEPTMNLLNYVGLRPQSIDEKSLVIPTNWPLLNLIRVRPEDIPNIVESGSVVMGITGLDYVVESGASVNIVERLGFGRGKLVVAFPQGSGVEDLGDIRDGMRIATKYVNIARRFFEELGRGVRIVRISGSAEVMPMLGVADGIVDVMSTGTTLRLHGLKPVGVVMESEAVLIAPRDPNDDYSEFINKFLVLLRGALSSNNRKLVLMNVPEQSLESVLKILPAMEGPTIADIAGKPMKEVMSVVPEDYLPELLPMLKRVGAKDILVLSIEKVIP